MAVIRPFSLLAVCLLATGAAATAQHDAPNVLFAIADDWGWPHASAYGDPVVETPNFDRIASEGALVHHAYVSSPSCTPSRGAILTGQWHWRLEGAANLWSVFPDRFETYQELLKAAGYRTGSTGKAWGPGRTETKGMIEHRDRDAEHRRLYELAFAKRPAVELYDLRSDPDQQVNVADEPEYLATRDELAERLMERLRATGDPRAMGGGDTFDEYPYLGGAPLHPSLPRQPPGALRPPADQP